MDPVAPLMHEFTYQAMAVDLLPIEGGTRYRYSFENSRGIREDRTAVLSETDQIWTATRHMHLLAANEKLKADFNKFLADNEVFRGRLVLCCFFFPASRLICDPEVTKH